MVRYLFSPAEWVPAGEASPGGEGIERDMQVLEDCTASLITERRVHAHGVWLAVSRATGENWLLAGGDESSAERLPDKCTRGLEGRRRRADAHARRGGWVAPGGS